MTTYTHHLSVEQPSLFRRLSDSFDPVSVTYHSIEICKASISPSGEVRMELPDSIAGRLERGEASVRPFAVRTASEGASSSETIHSIRIVDVK